MVEEDKVRMHQFVIQLMDVLKKTRLYILHTRRAAILLFNNYSCETFILDTSMQGVLGVVTDYPEIFYLSGDGCFIGLRNPEQCSELVKMWPVPQKERGLIKEAAQLFKDRNECEKLISKDLEEYESQILDNISYINWICKTLEDKDGAIQTDTFLIKDSKEAENLYLTKYLFSALAKFYGKKLYDKHHRESYEFYHEWKGKNMYIRVSKIRGVDNMLAYGIFKLNKTPKYTTPSFYKGEREYF